MQLLGRDMTVTGIKKQLTKGQTLARRSQSGIFQAPQRLGKGPVAIGIGCHTHAFNMVVFCAV